MYIHCNSRLPAGVVSLLPAVITGKIITRWFFCLVRNVHTRLKTVSLWFVEAVYVCMVCIGDLFHVGCTQKPWGVLVMCVCEWVKPHKRDQLSGECMCVDAWCWWIKHRVISRMSNGTVNRIMRPLLPYIAKKPKGHYTKQVLQMHMHAKQHQNVGIDSIYVHVHVYSYCTLLAPIYMHLILHIFIVLHVYLEGGWGWRSVRNCAAWRWSSLVLIFWNSYIASLFYDVRDCVSYHKIYNNY